MDAAGAAGAAGAAAASSTSHGCSQPSATSPRAATTRATTTTTTTTTTRARPLHGLSDLDDARPLHTASVRPDTTLAHPKPIAHPLVPPLSHHSHDVHDARHAHHAHHLHPVPDHLLRSTSGSAARNIAQLEATAERLSMTSSIDDAIRELHAELKRSDSRRSARLGLSPPAPVDHLSASSLSSASRHLSARASIVSLNGAARHGGYSPAAFVMSPSTSLTSRLPSGSASSAAHGDVVTLEYILSRHGPGKCSVRSARSGRLSLAEISESDPVSLTRQAFDEADAAPPLEEQSPEALQLTRATTGGPASPSDAAFHQMSGHHAPAPQALSHDDYDSTAARVPQQQPGHASSYPGQAQRPASGHSTTTFEQARDAFIDFDGVHCEASDEQDSSPILHLEMSQPAAAPAAVPAGAPAHGPAQGPGPAPVPVSMARPTSFIDPSTGTNMLYYPARVPAMLNLPPKLSSKAKSAGGRDHRRSQVLDTMMDVNTPDMSTSPRGQHRRRSTQTSFGLGASSSEAPVKNSWLPDPVADHRNSFAALSSFGGPFDTLDPQGASRPDEKQPSLLAESREPSVRGEAVPDHLRRPERLSKALKNNNRKSVMSMLSSLPSQLRASAFFDVPSAAPDVEIKDGSAMATLDSILDASATAPVSAFTDHVFAGKLGAETYGKQTKQKKTPSSAVTGTGQAPPAVAKPSKRMSSMMWLGKHGSSHEDLEQKRPHSSLALASARVNDATVSGEPPTVNTADGGLWTGGESNDGQQQQGEETRTFEAAEDGEEEAEEQDDSYHGPPTTLLAELQLRKQQQKQRARNMGQGLPNSNYATLLEMDTVAETQKKNRQSRRVNLAWEGNDTALDQDESDDDDVPLAIIAAMQRGAKNLADLERPLGLMERREMEDNEPLSHRRARLQGVEPPPPPPAARSRASMMSLSASRLFEGVQPLQPEVLTPSATSQTPAEVEEIEDETLGNRRRRLATKDGELPKTRPVSSAFSAELLSQFGGAEESKPRAKSDRKEGDTKAGIVSDAAGEEEETLGQRRRRLQAEREAREREMGLGHPAGAPSHRAQEDGQRLSLANVL
ncbi:hypothetical protein E4U42_001518, partial [Claviceps africana]